MTPHWTGFPGAPPPGTRLCPLSDVLPGSLRSLMVTGFPILLLRDTDGLRGFVNLCPHQFLPLDHRADQIRSADGTQIICSNHGACFDALTGVATAGPALGDCLAPIPLEQTDADILIARTGAPGPLS